MKKLITTLYLAASTSATAAYPTDVLQKFSVVFLTESKNLLQERETVKYGSNDWEVATVIGKMSIEFNSDLGGLADLSIIHAAMVDDRDRNTLARSINIRKEIYGETCEIHLNYINKAVTAYLVSNAISNSTYKIRQNILESCDYVKNWK